MGEKECGRCHGPNVVWVAPSPLWNAVMRRGGSINGEESFSIVCPTCFAELAEHQAIAFDWVLDARRVEIELEVVTPSGRVWDPTTMMWLPVSLEVPK